MKQLFLFLLELVRILVVLIVVGSTLGMLLFTRLYTEDHDAAEQLIWIIHFGLTILITFVWYRWRGQYTGWYRKKEGRG